MNKLFLLVLTICFVSFAEAKDKTRILIIGDSITAGYGVSKKEAFPSQLQILLDKSGLSAEVINAGTSGSTSASAENRLRWHLRSKPNIVIIALGANDGLRGFPVATTKSNLLKVLDLANKNKVKSFIAGMKLPKNYGEPYRTQFEKLFSELAKSSKVHLIPFLLKDVAGQSQFNLADGIHPNEAGHKIIAKTVFASLKGHL